MQEYFSTLSEYIPILLENGHEREYIEARIREILGEEKATEVCSWLFDWLDKNDTSATLKSNTQMVEKLHIESSDAGKTTEVFDNKTKETQGGSINDPSPLEPEVLWPKPKKKPVKNESAERTHIKSDASRRSVSVSSDQRTHIKSAASRRSVSVSSDRRTPGDSRASSSRASSLYLGGRSFSRSTDLGGRSFSRSTDRSVSTDREFQRYGPYPRGGNHWREDSYGRDGSGGRGSYRRRPGTLGVPSVNRPMGPLKCAVCGERYFHMPQLQEHMKSHFGDVGGQETRRGYREPPNAYSLWFHKA